MDFTVLMIRKHPTQNVDIAVITSSNVEEGQIWLIGVEGLEKIEPKFKKGDLVIGNDNADCYTITKKGWIGSSWNL